MWCPVRIELSTGAIITKPKDLPVAAGLKLNSHGSALNRLPKALKAGVLHSPVTRDPMAVGPRNVFAADKKGQS